jgi:hypothetical protein
MWLVIGIIHMPHTPLCKSPDRHCSTNKYFRSLTVTEIKDKTEYLLE